jgi:hypothetical protein
MTLTPKEQERLAYIAGDTERAELLAQVGRLENVPTDAGDASCGYPDEGFLDRNIGALRAIASKMRGPNRAALDEQISELEELQDEMTRLAEYGRDELQKFETRLIEATQ